MTRARLRRGVRKRREAREARDRKARGVWAASLPPPPLEGPDPCTHTWGEPVTVSFSCDSRDVIRVCAACQGFVRRCKRCRRFHLVYQGQGGEYSMPPLGLRVVAEGARVRPKGLGRRAHTVRVDA